MPKIGLKIWSKNLQYIPLAQGLYLKKVFDYIELFTVPGSLDTIPSWKALKIPYVLHAPHSYAGLNVSQRASREDNILLVGQVEEFYKALSPVYVIFHPGINGELSESRVQFQIIKEKFPQMFKKILIENKPLIGLKGERCIGASPEDIKQLLDSTGCQFCLDFGHAICYAVAAGKKWKEVISELMAFNPAMYHLSDGFLTPKDDHEHLGDGEYDLPYLVKLIEKDKYVSLETKRDHQDSLDDFVLDAQRLRDYANI